MRLGERIKAEREARGWSQLQLSEKSGVDVGTISALEVRRSVRSQFAPAIAAAFGMSLEDLLSSAIPGPSAVTPDPLTPVLAAVAALTPGRWAMVRARLDDLPEHPERVAEVAADVRVILEPPAAPTRRGG